MDRLNNPFVIYGYKGPEYFCDRQEETKKICLALRNERNVTLISPRRMGKTGLIHHVFEEKRRDEHEACCFYIDIFPTKNLAQDRMFAYCGEQGYIVYDRFFAIWLAKHC